MKKALASRPYYAVVLKSATLLSAAVLLFSCAAQGATCQAGNDSGCPSTTSGLTGAIIAGTSTPYMYTSPNNGAFYFAGAPTGVRGANFTYTATTCAGSTCTGTRYWADNGTANPASTAPVFMMVGGNGFGQFALNPAFWGSTTTEAGIEIVQAEGWTVVIPSYPTYINGAGGHWPGPNEALQCLESYMGANASSFGNVFDLRIFGDSSGALNGLMMQLVPAGTNGPSCTTTINASTYKVTAIVTDSTPLYLATYNSLGTSMYAAAAGITANICGFLGVATCTLANVQASDTSLLASPGMWTSSWAAQMGSVRYRMQVGGNSLGNIGYIASNCATPSNCDDIVVTPVNEVPFLTALNGLGYNYQLWDGSGAHTSNFNCGFGDQVANCFAGKPLQIVDALNFLAGGHSQYPGIAGAKASFGVAF